MFSRLDTTSPSPGTPRPSRLRRFFGSTIMRIVLGLICIIGAVAGAQAGLSMVLPTTGAAVTTGVPDAKHAPIPMLVGAVILCCVALAVYACFVRITEGQWPLELRPRRAWLEIAAGAATGFALFSLTVGVLWLAGAYHIDAIESSSQLPAILAAGLSAALVSAVVEELLARGIIFRIAEGSIGSWWAIAVSAALFGLAHIANPHASLAVALGLGLQAGVLLAAAFMTTRRLYLPMGLHFGWNFIQAAIFGGALSGGKVHSVFQSRLTGPDWLSGGQFGVEGSVFATMICAGAAVAFLVFANGEGRVIGPFWRKDRRGSEKGVEVRPSGAGVG